MVDVFATSDKKESLGNKMREKRFAHFLDCIKNLPRPITILDIGGTLSYWENLKLENNENFQITLLNLESFDTDYKNISSVKGDATNLEEFKDESFDIVYSNSVIEHLYTWKNQILMAEECKRVGKHFYIQTPNKYFFVEPHYVLPYFQYLPNHIKYWILTKTKLSRNQKWDPEYAKQYISEIRLLSSKEMGTLFSNKLYKEKFLGMSKSIIAHNF